MKLLFLSADNLRNGPFVKDLVYNYKDLGKSIILHDHFGSIADTRFVSKRLSALMSEEMITNNAFSGDQRGIFQLHAGAVQVREALLRQSLEAVDLLLLNALTLQGGTTAPLDPMAVLTALRQAFGLHEVYLFPKNSRSPLVAQRRLLSDVEQIAQWRAVYDEEAAVLDLAQHILPVVLAAPGNFRQPAP